MDTMDDNPVFSPPLPTKLPLGGDSNPGEPAAHSLALPLS
jgi:hypothetical protein